MAKYCLNFETGEYEWIERNGYSWDTGDYTYNWDDSAYKSEEEEECRRRDEEEEEERRRRDEEEEERHRSIFGSDDD